MSVRMRRPMVWWEVGTTGLGPRTGSGSNHATYHDLLLRW